MFLLDNVDDNTTGTAVEVPAGDYNMKVEATTMDGTVTFYYRTLEANERVSMGVFAEVTTEGGDEVSLPHCEVSADLAGESSANNVSAILTKVRSRAF